MAVRADTRARRVEPWVIGRFAEDPVTDQAIVIGLEKVTGQALEFAGMATQAIG